MRYLGLTLSGLEVLHAAADLTLARQIMVLNIHS